MLNFLVHFGIRPFSEGIPKGPQGIIPRQDKGELWGRGQMDRSDTYCAWATSYHFSSQSEKTSAKDIFPPKHRVLTNKWLE